MPSQMLTHIEYWPVGSTASSYIPASVDEISAHLMDDWAPSLPIATGATFMGWPSFLLSPLTFNNLECLRLHDRTATTERQWKGVMSWMLGVAVARHILKIEKYRWIAPVSAFFGNNRQQVFLGQWPTALSPGVVETSRPVGTKTRLTPDYLVLRSTANGQYDWGVVEAKGNARSLKPHAVCPPDWSKQVRNVVVAVNGTPIQIPRYVVIATRVNPNAIRASTRRVQVRAWNSAERLETLAPAGATEIVVAHLFGLFRALRMPANAQALAMSLQARGGRVEQAGLFDDLRRQGEVAAAELERQSVVLDSRDVERQVRLDVDSADAEVGLSSVVIRLTRRLQMTISQEEAAAAVTEADAELDEWLNRQAHKLEGPPRAVLPFGVEVRLRRLPVDREL